MVQRRIKCPKCLKAKFWKTNNSRLKCKNCRKIFTVKKNPHGIENKTLKEVDSSINAIDFLDMLLKIMLLCK